MKKTYSILVISLLILLPVQSNGIAAPNGIIEEIDDTTPIAEPEILTPGIAAHQRHEPTPVSTPTRYLQERSLRWPVIHLPDDDVTPYLNNNATNVIPTVGMIITEDTTLEPGTYSNNIPGSTFITITADEVTLDCNGATLEDVTANHLTDGIKIAPGLNNVSVTNCTLKNMFLGIISGSSDPDGPISTGLSITNNHFISGDLANEEYIGYWSHLMIRNTNNSEIAYNWSDPNNPPLRFWQYGIFASFWESDSNNIHNNETISNIGMHVTLDSDNNDIHHNTAYYIDWLHGGIEIDRASNTNTIHHNTASFINQNPNIINSGSGIMLNGFDELDAPQYHEAAHHNTINDNVAISNYRMYSGVSLVHDAHDNMVTRNSASGTYVGIEAYFGQTNEAESPTYYFPHHNTIDGNTTTQYETEIYTDGIWLGNGTHHFTITNNTYTGGYFGIRAMYLVGSQEAPQVPITDMIIRDNRILNTHSYGLFNPNQDVIERWDIYHNYFFQNGADPMMIDGAVVLQSSSPEIFVYENTFIENGLTGGGTYDQLSASPQTQLQRLGRGNYYSDFDEPSEGCSDTDLNGICDLPRNFLTGAIDLYPLVNPTFCENNNCPPIIRPIPPITVNEQDLAIIRVNTYDYEHDPLTITLSDTRFNSFDSCWPGRNAWVWGTNKSSSGVYPVTVTVSDGVHQVQQSTVVTVRDTCYYDKWGKMRCSNYVQRLYCY